MEGFFPLAGFSAFVAFGTFGDGAAFVAIFFFLFLGSDEEAAARFGDPGGGTLSFGELGEATDERPVVMRALAISFAFFVFFLFGVFPPFPCFARFPDAGTAWYGSGAFRLRLELLPTRFATAPGSGSHDSTLSWSLELPVGVPPPSLSSEYTDKSSELMPSSSSSLSFLFVSLSGQSWWVVRLCSEEPHLHMPLCVALDAPAELPFFAFLCFFNLAIFRG
jgi:hypothetical protein